LYGDTDSLFLESPRKEQIEDLVKWSNEELKMELEFDKFYRYSVFSRLKKNYLGVYPDGNIEIKGLTGKKRHMPQFLKNAFMEMIGALGEVQSPKDFEAARVKIKEIVRDCHTNVKKRLYPLSDLALHVTVSRSLESYTKTTPQHVKAAWLLVKAGHEIKPGDIISFVKSRDDVGVKPVQLADIKEVDVEKYLEYLRSTFDQVLDAIGISYNEIFGISKLESFLWGPKH
jgi:DNA polymerase I